MLRTTSHRPFPLPTKRWILKQSWKDVSFVHWPVKKEKLQEIIPEPLKVDMYDGQAWISLIMFHMDFVRYRKFPWSLTPPFTEVNVRTYVTYQGIPGIYFLSIDVNHWTSYIIAKQWYRLPYNKAAVSWMNVRGSLHYESNRKQENHIKLENSITPLTEVYTAKKETLDYWLTERYRLYSTNNSKRLFYADIHHRPWPLQNAEVNIYHNSLLSQWKLGVREHHPFLSHFSSGVDTLFWNIQQQI